MILKDITPYPMIMSLPIITFTTWFASMQNYAILQLKEKKSGFKCNLYVFLVLDKEGSDLL